MDRPLLRRVAGAVTAGLLAASTAGCTGGHHRAGHESSPSGSPTAPASSATLHVQVTHVAGSLSSRRRSTLVAHVRRTLSGYAGAAFLAGRYPRTDFRRSFGEFTSGAAARARQDQDLLTNRSLGATTRSVRLARGTAYVSVLAPGGRPAGATAAVHWVFVVERGDQPAQRVRLEGRLLLTKDKAGAWRIFGYRLTRSATPAGGGS